MVSIRVLAGDCRPERVEADDIGLSLVNRVGGWEYINVARIQRIEQLEREWRPRLTAKLADLTAGVVVGGVAAGAGGLTRPAGAIVGAIAGAVFAGRPFELCHVLLSGRRRFVATVKGESWGAMRKAARMEWAAEKIIVAPDISENSNTRSKLPRLCVQLSSFGSRSTSTDMPAAASENVFRTQERSMASTWKAKMKSRMVATSAAMLLALSAHASAKDYGKFLDDLKVKWLKDGRDMQLLSDFRFLAPDNEVWTAKSGATIDGASIPQVFWSIIGGPFEGLYRDASVIHDYYCEHHLRDWRATHHVFYLGMRAAGVSEPKADVMYYAVYAFGPRWTTERRNGVVNIFKNGKHQVIVNTIQMTVLSNVNISDDQVKRLRSFQRQVEGGRLYR